MVLHSIGSWVRSVVIATYPITSMKELALQGPRLEGTGSRLASAGARFNWRELFFGRREISFREQFSTPPIATERTEKRKLLAKGIVINLLLHSINRSRVSSELAHGQGLFIDL